MPQTIIHKALSVAPEVAFNSPAETVLNLPSDEVTRIVVHIRKGHTGLTGLMIYYGAQQVVPSTLSAQYLKGDNRTYEFDVDLFLTGQSWLAILANTDVYAHTFDVDFEFEDSTLDDELALVFVPLAFESQGVRLPA